MNQRKYFAIISVICMAAGVIVFMGNGCSGQFQVNSPSLTNSAANVTGAGMTTPPPDIVPGSKTVSVVYAQQILDQFSACAGVSSPSDSTLKIYEANKGAISVYGTAATMTSPMMMSIISISGELCNDLINQEIPAQRMFKLWNLTGNGLPTTGAMNDSISRFALSCWQRPETSEERQFVMDAVSSVQDATPNAARTAALIMCTTMLSSLNSLLN